MRHFIRHPINVPIEVGATDRRQPGSIHARNVSRGGLAFQSHESLAPGSLAALRFPCVHPPFEAQVRVAWCLPVDAGFEVGVEFLDSDDGLRARMIEQVCYIENYRKRVQLSEQRELSIEEAAHEWVAKYAAQFFDTGPDDLQ
jgi:PilZ domain